MHENPDQRPWHDTRVMEFHRVFALPVNHNPAVTPQMAVRVRRIRLIAEELIETARAFGVHLRLDSEEAIILEGGERALNDPAQIPQVEPSTVFPDYDVVEAADGLGDLRYLVDGGNLECGFPGELIQHEIHRSNMSKLGENGMPIYREDGKVLKGPNYSPANIRHVLGLPELPKPAPVEPPAEDQTPADTATPQE